VSLIAWFRGSKVRQKIIREKLKNFLIFSKCNKNQKITKIPLKKKCLENRWKNALFTANNVILRFFFWQNEIFSKIHKTVSYDIDKQNSQVSRILMNPRPIFSNRSMTQSTK
jgi:hypothetical protein